MASNPWMLRPLFGGWQLVMLPAAAWQLVPGRYRARVWPRAGGVPPGLGGLGEDALEARHQGRVQRSSIAACIPSIVVDSTMKLPSEPDPGSAGSSSCVSSYSYPVGDCSTFEVLADSPTFNTATSRGPSPCDEL